MHGATIKITRLIQRRLYTVWILSVT